MADWWMIWGIEAVGVEIGMVGGWVSEWVV